MIKRIGDCLLAFNLRVLTTERRGSVFVVPRMVLWLLSFGLFSTWGMFGTLLIACGLVQPSEQKKAGS